MDTNEFQGSQTYLARLKREQASDEETAKGKEFYTIMSSYVQGKDNLYYRDFLDIDGTFAVAVNYSGTLKEHVDIYQSVIDIVESTMYRKVKKIGLFELGTLNGFWILLG